MKRINIYSTPTCPHCKKLKDYLSSKNIKFNDIDVSADPDKIREMIDKSGQMGTPVIDIDGEIIAGFDKKKIDNILNIQ
jgi:glutaredoxin-like YruB-family protein